MKQPVKRGKTVHGKKSKAKERLRKPNGKLERQHPKYGTSKLEDDFAREFLDKLGIKYKRQFEAVDIGRFYDFAIYPNGGGIILLEIDGGYWHSDPRLVEEKDMNQMQKRNRRVDELKNKWALLHGIPIMRIWEKDIRENPSMVLKQLKERLYIEEKAQDKKKERNKRHRNILK